MFLVKTTSFANLRDHLQELFAVEGTPDEIMSDNGPPFNGKEFSSFLTGLGIRHTTSSPNYPQSNGFIERQIQIVKRLMEKAASTGRSFQETLTSLRAQPLGDGLPSLADTSWEEPFNKKGNPSGCSCSSSISNCFTDQVHQEQARPRPGKQRPSEHW